MYEAAGTIAVVFHDFPLGGSERIAIRLMNRWADQGRKVIAFCGAARGPLVDMIGANVEIVECSPVIPRGFGSRRALGYALAAFLERKAVDVLFAPGNFHWPVLSVVGALVNQARPAMVTQVSTPLMRHGRGKMEQAVYDLLTRYRLRDVDALIALSSPVVAQADRLLGRRITQCIRLPVLDDVADMQPLARASGNVIVAAGRLVKEKGFDVALRAFAQLKDRTAKLVVLGEGSQRDQLLALAGSLGVRERVEFMGYVPDISPWLERARVFLLSSFYEGYGAVLVEALAAGRPVVSTDCTPAVSDLLHTTHGCRVAPVGDAAALAENLNRILASPPPDPRALANAVADFRIGPIAAHYLDVFDRVYMQRARLQPEAPARLAEHMAYV